LIRPYSAVLLPRILRSVAGFSKTFLVAAIIRHLEAPKNERNPRQTFGLLAATALIFYGDAIADILYRQKLYRSYATLRGGLSSLIYRHSLSMRSVDSEVPTITLMSNDVDGIIHGLEFIISVPISLAEVVVGIWLLWRQIGPISLGPVLLVVACSFFETRIGMAMGDGMVEWNKSVQKRVGLTSNLLRSMKSVKMSGLVEVSSERVQSARIEELELGKKYSWHITWMNAVGKPASTRLLVIAPI
jgi:ATP-binding cassette subfamily C (CFTR/MRP) protein 1